VESVPILFGKRPLALADEYPELMFPRKSGHKNKRIVYNATIGGI
jgi:hypothetical protein